MEHSHSMVYRGILLRPLEMKDIEILRQMRNRSKSPFLRAREVITAEMQMEWFREQMECPDSMTWVIDDEDCPGQVHGAAALFSITGQEAEFGRFMVAEEIQNRGAGYKAVKAMLLFAFGQLKLKRVTLHCDKDNYSAIHIYQKVGFRILRETERQGGIPEYFMEITSL